jgi:glycosyltransferase involved in cell wall biosynthesis
MAKKIYCLAEMALQFDLQTDLKGGGERVFSDMLSLFKELGYEVYAYQFSYDKKPSKFRRHKIIGLGNIPKFGNQTLGYQKGIEDFYKIAEENKADGIYLLSMNLASVSSKIKTITTSHGIFFNDYQKNDYIKPIEMLDMFKRSLRNIDHMISCDTDTLHTASIYCPQYINKMSYVCNYVDLNKFTPKIKKDDGIFKILYPRRLDLARGYQVMARATDKLLEKYSNIEVIFCGQGNERETNDLHNWMKTKDGRVKHIICEPDQMPNAYDNISVGIVPTLCREGTSLSLLELYASNVLPITTWVGGLSDISHDQFTSLVIPPNDVDALVNAIEYVINNPEHVNEMRKNGQRMIKHYSKQRWEKQITEVIKKIYGEP